MNINRLIVANKDNIILTILLSVFYLLFLDLYPTIQMDEPWYANTAYNFSLGNGFVNTVVGYRGGDVFVLYTFIVGLFYKILGCTLFTTRIVSVIGAVIAGIFLLKIVDRVQLKRMEKYLVFAGFAFSNVFYIVFRSGRPEGWIVTFGIITIYFIVKFIQKKEMSTLLYLSLFSACAFLVHPNGVLFLINAYLIVIIELLKQKNVKRILLFGVTNVMLILIPFVIVFSDPTKWEEFLFQAQARNALGGESKSAIENLTAFVQTYTFGVKRLYIFLFELGILLFAVIFGRSKHTKYIAAFGLFNFIFSIFIFNPYISRSFSQILIFSIVCTIFIFEEFRPSKIMYQGIVFIFFLYILNNAAGDLYILYKNRNNDQYNKVADKIRSKVTDLNENTVIMSNIEFWFPFKNTEFYNSYTNYNYKKYPSINHLIDSGEIDFIVLGSFKLDGISATAGREENVSREVLQYYNLVTEYASDNGQIIDEIQTNQFGIIKIWKIIN